MKLTRTWWGEAFIDSLRGFIDDGRLQRGRSYRHSGRILEFTLKDNQIRATVRGNINPYFGVYKEPKYKVTLKFSTISTNDWQTIIQNLCANPSWLAKLMLNEIPDDIEQAFDQHNFLPRRYTDIKAECSCPDYANPCKHIAGIYFRLAKLLDSEPMLLFPLRGLPSELLQAELKKSELGTVFAEHLLSSETPEREFKDTYYTPIMHSSADIQYTQSNYWVMPTWQLDTPETEKPTNAILIKKQGDYPAFWHRNNSFIAAMEAIYYMLSSKNKKML